MTLRLGSVQTNLKGGKYLPAEPTVCWNTTQWAEILYEPSAFSKGEPNERVSLCLELTDEMRTAVEGLEKQVSDKKLEGTTVQSCIKQTRSKAQCLKLKVNLNKARFWDADGNRLQESPAELRGRKALVAVEVRQLWIMGQQCGLLMEAKDLKLQDATPQVCPL